MSTQRVSFAGKFIETTVTDKASVAEEWVRDICSTYNGKRIIVGLDYEWKPNYSRFTTSKTATLQLCVDTKCLILQLIYMDCIPQSIKSFLKDSNFTFVGVEVGDDVLKLRNDYGLNCSRTADIQELAICRWPGRFRRPGLKDLASEVMGLFMPKPKHVCLSNWQSRVLDNQQIEYACIDAYASYWIGHKLLIEN